MIDLINLISFKKSRRILGVSRKSLKRELRRHDSYLRSVSYGGDKYHIFEIDVLRLKGAIDKDD